MGDDVTDVSADAASEARPSRSRRFMDRYEQRRRERAEGHVHPWKRPIRVTCGILLILGGVAIGWLPGPGFVILALPGAFLVASEIRWAAQAMDRAEQETLPRARRAWGKVRRKPRTEEQGSMDLGPDATKDAENAPDVASEPDVTVPER